MEHEGNGVLVNCCCPGHANTDMSFEIKAMGKSPRDASQSSLDLSLLAPASYSLQGVFVLDA